MCDIEILRKYWIHAKAIPDATILQFPNTLLTSWLSNYCPLPPADPLLTSIFFVNPGVDSAMGNSPHTLIAREADRQGNKQKIPTLLKVTSLKSLNDSSRTMGLLFYSPIHVCPEFEMWGSPFFWSHHLAKMRESTLLVITLHLPKEARIPTPIG